MKLIQYSEFSSQNGLHKTHFDKMVQNQSQERILKSSTEKKKNFTYQGTHPAPPRRLMRLPRDLSAKFCRPGERGVIYLKC